MTSQTTPATPSSTKFDRKLLAYVAAASAAGVAALASPLAADAEVVYTPANRTITFDGKSILDLNNDHVADFFFRGGGLGNFSQNWIHPLNSNRVLLASNGEVAALPAGSIVGPGEQVYGRKFIGQNADMEGWCECSGSSDFTGNWINATNKYLGLDITINGQHHFGWARLTYDSYGKFTLTGYAYETIPGKAIVTGATSDKNDAKEMGAAQPTNAFFTSASASLGVLARGAEGLELWRQE
jgi:hypothetical protein